MFGQNQRFRLGDRYGQLRLFTQRFGPRVACAEQCARSAERRRVDKDRRRDGGQIVAYPFLTASVFHEFEGTVTASVTTAGAFVAPGPVPLQSSGNITTSSIGTFGQFGIGSAFELANTGWLGYARIDCRTGEFIQGYSISAGLRYEIDDRCPVAMNSYPVKGSMKAVPAEAYDWTGAYVGAFAGSTWGRTHWETDIDPDYAGVLAGGQAGYNYQKFGALKPMPACPRGETLPHSAVLLSWEDDVGALGPLTARFGYTWGRALFYAKGGWAFGQVTAGSSLNFTAVPVRGAINVAQSTNWENGWTVGAGMEYALADRCSAKAEYMHYEFPPDAFAVAQNATTNVKTSGDVVRIGVNYHFWPGPY
jgi:opacity protein-like surface antigen